MSTSATLINKLIGRTLSALKKHRRGLVRTYLSDAMRWLNNARFCHRKGFTDTAATFLDYAMRNLREARAYGWEG